MSPTVTATTDIVELISYDCPKLDIRKVEYDLDEVARKRTCWIFSKAMLKVPKLPLLESLKQSDHLLTTEKILNNPVDKDLMFRDLDEVGLSCPLGLYTTFPSFLPFLSIECPPLPHPLLMIRARTEVVLLLLFLQNFDGCSRSFLFELFHSRVFDYWG